jgi:hypothetical protein
MMNQINLGVLKIACLLSFVTNVTPQKKNGRKFCGEVFSQGTKEHQTWSYPRMVKTISLGIPKASPMDLHTIGLQTF